MRNSNVVLFLSAVAVVLFVWSTLVNRLEGVETLNPNSECDYLSQYDLCLRGRQDPIMKILLVGYGSYISEEDITTYKSQIEDRFNKAVHGKIKLEIISTAVLRLPAENSRVMPHNKLHNYEEIQKKFPWTDPASWKRLWYYYNMEQCEIAEEVFETIKNSHYASMLLEADATVVLGEPQFEGIAVNCGRISLLELPVEIAWGQEDTYKIEHSSVWHLADEIIHELGHFMGLGHASSQCMKGTLDYRCCIESINKDDVMSYCRKRTQISADYWGEFKECHLQLLEQEFIPRLLEGGEIYKIKGSCG